jgi:hypothetical protein
MQDVQDARPPAAPEMGPGPQTRHTNAGDAPVVNTVRARQGVTGHHVRVVLALGLAAVVLAFAIAYYLT